MEFEHYAIDGALSSVKLRAFASVAFAALGHSPTLAMREFVGRARFAHRTLEQACVQIEAKAGSLTVLDTMTEEHGSAIE